MSPETEKVNPDLNQREQKLVAIVVEEMRDLRLFGTKPKHIRVKLGEGQDPVDMKKVAQVLHTQGFSIEHKYRFDEEENAHIFRPEPYEGVPSLQAGKSETPFSDFFDEVFGDK
ncbi:hypothetical protein IID22_00710 [Patescibacteria group bacterium]|nr:hypothetical protein [Patescibacteria group bacterium]